MAANFSQGAVMPSGLGATSSGCVHQCTGIPLDGLPGAHQPTLTEEEQVQLPALVDRPAPALAAWYDGELAGKFDADTAESQGHRSCPKYTVGN